MQARGTKSVQNNLRLRFIALALTMAKLRAEIIRDLFHPLNDLAVKRFLDSDVRHGETVALAPALCGAKALPKS
jgi:hypothetical protein